MTPLPDFLAELHAAFLGGAGGLGGETSGNMRGPVDEPHATDLHLAGFTRVYDELVAATALPDLQAKGRRLAVVAAAAIGDAVRAASLDPDRFRFGRRWPDQPWWTRLAGTSALVPNPVLWPRDEAGTIVPLLAIDAYLDWLAAPESGNVRTNGTERASAGIPDRAEPTSDQTSPVAATTDAEITAPNAGRSRDRSGHGGAAMVERVTHPAVSVIVVNWNGRQHLTRCFESLQASDWPAERLQLICVDNGSTDGSRELLTGRFPRVHLVSLSENRGFTGGNAAGVERASGDVLVFLNNDMRVAPDAIRNLVGALGPERPCAAARVLSWDGTALDFVRGTLNFEARGFQEHYGARIRPELAATADTFFPNGGAFAIRRDVYEAAGGFDPALFAYYDDVDLGWAVRLLGHDIAVAHGAIAYHRHGATSRTQPHGQKRFLMERNGLWIAMTRYAEATLQRVLPAMLLLAARRIVQESAIGFGQPALRPVAARSSRSRTRGLARLAALMRPAPRALSRFPVDRLAALGAALADAPRIRERRRAVQGSRVVPDRALLPLFGRALEYISSLPSYAAAQDALVETLALDELFAGRSRVLIITHEPIGTRMSGPAIRALEIGRALARRSRVTVATPFEPGLVDPRCTIAPYSFGDSRTIRALAESSDLVVLQGFTLARYPFLTDMQLPLAVDLYCPFTIEYLETAALGRKNGSAATGRDAEHQMRGFLGVVNQQLENGDFFLCASERQRDFWLGALHAAGRVNPATYGTDPTLRSLVDVVPFGVPTLAFRDAVDQARAARGGTPAIKGRVAGIGPSDRVLLWGGSILDWQDPQTLVLAVAELARHRGDVKLVFMGTRHPNPDIPEMRALRETQAIARERGVLDTHVFFNEWVPYEERAAWLAEGDVGVSTHRDHLETHLSFRTRMLDYIWAGLPIVCTDGDVFAELVRERRLGLTVPSEDAPALASALERTLDDAAFRAECRAQLSAVAAELRWDRVVAPLARFAAARRFAADREPAVRAMRERLRQGYTVSKWLRRTALGAGLSETSLEKIKQWSAVRAAMRLRNQIAIARAKREGSA